MSNEQGESFHQDVMTMESRHQGGRCTNMMADYCWFLQRDGRGTSYVKQQRERSLLQQLKVHFDTNIYLKMCDQTFCVVYLLSNKKYCVICNSFVFKYCNGEIYILLVKNEFLLKILNSAPSNQLGTIVKNKTHFPQ